MKNSKNTKELDDSNNIQKSKHQRKKGKNKKPTNYLTQNNKRKKEDID